MTKAYAVAGDTANIAATTTSAPVAIFGNANVVRILNFGAVPSHVAFGNTAGITASTTDLVLGPNEVAVIMKGGATFAAARTASGTATVYFTPVT